MITVENVRHFVTAVENQGVLRAADKIFISASSITRSIQQIEAELGKPLFDRVGRALSLNQDGQQFYEKARDLLHSYALLMHEESARGELRGHYRIGASHFLCEHLLCDLLITFMAQHKKATIEVCSLDSHMLMKKLHAGEIDLGLSFSPKVSEMIGSEKLREGQLYLCGGKDHPLMGRPFGEIKKGLSDYPCIIHRPHESVERCDNHPMFKKHRIRPAIQAYWDSDYFALGVLSKSGHWSMLPDVVIDSDKRIARFAHAADWNAPYEIALLWNQRKAVIDLKESVLEILNAGI